MRTLTLFALSLAGMAVMSGDAFAFGKRKGGNGCNGGGGGGGGCSGYVSHGGWSCGGGGYSGCHGGGYGGCHGIGYSGYHSSSGGHYSHSGYGGQAVGYDTTTSGGYLAGGSTVTGTDGVTYMRGGDGYYYSSNSAATLGGFTTQPYYGSAMSGPYPGTYSTYPGTYTYPGMYRGTGYPGGVYPAGYTSGYYGSGVNPAGYTAPLTMPGINIGAGGINITPGLLPGGRR